MGEYAEYGFDQQRFIYYVFVACGIWCLADVSSVSPSSEEILVLCACVGGVVYTVDQAVKHAKKFVAEI